MRWMDDYCHDLFLCSTNNNFASSKYNKTLKSINSCQGMQKGKQKIEKLLKMNLHGMKQKLQE
jgi:hypothetical protein